MEPIFVSVVMPAYNQASFVGNAIRSVLNQSYTHFEVIIVDDASPDDTSKIVKSFSDSRVRLISHRKNLGLSASRNTGMLNSKGNVLALLDADDMYHPAKLQMHVEFLNDRHDIGATYNARFELHYSNSKIRGLWRPPLEITLLDLVKGFPFSPSDMVVRREWIYRVGPFDPDAGSAEDTDFPGRLALAGCKFAGIDRALNYRRYHSGRPRKYLRRRLNDVHRILDAIFADSRCPEEVLNIRDIALKYHLMALISRALLQEETGIAKEFILELIKIDPLTLEGYPCELLQYLISESIADESLNHELLVHKIFAQLPEQVKWSSEHYKYAIAYGYMGKGIRAALWGWPGNAEIYLSRAFELKACITDSILQSITYNLLSYEIEFGTTETQAAVERLSNCLNGSGNHSFGRQLKGSYFVNCAFRDYREGKYSRIPVLVLQAIAHTPSYCGNRGVIKILLRSLMKLGRD